MQELKDRLSALRAEDNAPRTAQPEEGAQSMPDPRVDGLTIAAVDALIRQAGHDAYYRGIEEGSARAWVEARAHTERVRKVEGLEGETRGVISAVEHVQGLVRDVVPDDRGDTTPEGAERQYGREQARDEILAALAALLTGVSTDGVHGERALKRGSATAARSMMQAVERAMFSGSGS